jgi:RsmE family RNA methyltransferase
MLDKAGVLIGPEGGWSDREKSLFTETGLPHINLHDFTLRAETAAIAAATKLLQ